MAGFAPMLPNLPINDTESLSCHPKLSIHLHKCLFLFWMARLGYTQVPSCVGSLDRIIEGRVKLVKPLLSWVLCRSYRLANSLESTSTGGGEAERKQAYLLVLCGEELPVNWKIQSRNWASWLCTRRIGGWYPLSCLPSSSEGGIRPLWCESSEDLWKRDTSKWWALAPQNLTNTEF